MNESLIDRIENLKKLGLQSKYTGRSRFIEEAQSIAEKLIVYLKREVMRSKKNWLNLNKRKRNLRGTSSKICR